MKQIIYLFCILSINSFPQFFLNDNNENELLTINLSSNQYCEIIRELYIWANQYMKQMNVDQQSKIPIIQYLFDVKNLFWDERPEKLVNSEKEFSEMYQDYFLEILKTFGIQNLEDKSQWNEIVYIIIAQISKRQDKTGQVCLRPSQAAMILFSLLESSKINSEKKQKLLNIFLKNLQENYNYEQDIENSIEQMFENQETWNQLAMQFSEQDQQFVNDFEQNIKQQINQRIFEIIETDNQEIKTLEYIELLEEKLGQRRDKLVEFEDGNFSSFYEKMISLVSMGKDLKNQKDTTMRQNFIKMTTTQEVQKLNNSINLLPIQVPSIFQFDYNSNIFEQVADYVLMEAYYLQNPTVERDYNQQEILNLEKAKINTLVLSRLIINHTTLNISYKKKQETIAQQQNSLSIIKDFLITQEKQQSILEFLNQSNDVHFVQTLKIIIFQDEEFSQQIKKKNQKQYLDLFNLLHYQDYYKNIQQNILLKFCKIFLFTKISQLIYEKTFSKEVDFSDYKEKLKQNILTNMQQFNQEEKNQYLDYFILYHFRAYSNDISLEFIANVQKSLYISPEEKIQEFSDIYIDMLYIDKLFFNEVNMIDEEKKFIVRKIISKVELGVKIITPFTGLIINKALKNFLEIINLIKLFIPNGNIHELLQRSQIFVNAEQYIEKYKDKFMQNNIDDTEMNKLKNLKKIQLMDQAYLDSLNKKKLNLKLKMFQLDQESWKSYEAKILWHNIQPQSGDFRIII